MSLKKKEAEWWDGLTKDKTLKRFIKTDFAKWCEEEDPEYTGDIPDPGGGMGGGMGGMPMAAPAQSNGGAAAASPGILQPSKAPGSSNQDIMKLFSS